MRLIASSLRVAGYVLVIAGLSSSCYVSLNLARADRAARQNTVASVRRAIELERGNSDYGEQLGFLLSGQGTGEDPRNRTLEDAAALNPWSSRVWMALGLAAEASGQSGKAERYFLNAARVDSRFDPRWALTNFYYRKGDAAKFWSWAREAAETSYDDTLAPLFHLCWIASDDGKLIFDQIVRNRPSTLAQYLSFLLAENRLDEAWRPARRLMKTASAEETAALLNYCDRLVGAGRGAGAVAVWNALVDRGLIAGQRLAAGTGSSLTNGDFAHEFRAQAFDWRPAAIPGILLSRSDGLRIGFSGKQPESCELLSQFVPVLPSRSYQFQLEYRTSDIAPNTGLRWRVLDAASGAELVSDSPHLSSEEWKNARVEFRTMDSCSLVRLALCYQRELGTTRIEGSIWLRNLTLRLGQ